MEAGWEQTNRLSECIGRKVGCQEKSDNYSSGHQGHLEVGPCLLFHIEVNAFYLIFKCIYICIIYIYMYCIIYICIPVSIFKTYYLSPSNYFSFLRGSG